MLPSFGGTYVEDDIEQNVSQFMELAPQHCRFMSPEEASQIIRNERKHPNNFIFYNALRSGYNFAYDIVDLMRQVVEIKAFAAIAFSSGSSCFPAKDELTPARSPKNIRV